jgi:hypothetical protein
VHSKQGSSKGSLGRFTAVQYNGSVEASNQGYSKGSLGRYITVQHIGLVGALIKAIIRGA